MSWSWGNGAPLSGLQAASLVINWCSLVDEVDDEDPDLLNSAHLLCIKCCGFLRTAQGNMFFCSFSRNHLQNKLLPKSVVNSASGVWLWKARIDRQASLLPSTSNHWFVSWLKLSWSWVVGGSWSFGPAASDMEAVAQMLQPAQVMLKLTQASTHRQKALQCNWRNSRSEPSHEVCLHNVINTGKHEMLLAASKQFCHMVC